MKNNPTFLLISVQEKSQWFQNLARALSNLGKFVVLPQIQAMQSISHDKYNVVIIDTSCTNNEQRLFSRVRNKQPQAHIVFVTASPTWQRARKAFLSGVIDYISKTLDESDFFCIFKDILTKTSQNIDQEERRRFLNENHSFS